MKLRRLVAGGDLKIYQEDEELELPEFVAEARELDAATAQTTTRVPHATQKMSRLLAGRDVSKGKAPGKITLLINQMSSPSATHVVNPRWTALDQRREAEERRLWAAFKALGPEEEVIREKAASLVPTDLTPGSRLQEDALRIRILHLMREREQFGAYASAHRAQEPEAPTVNVRPERDAPSQPDGDTVAVGPTEADDDASDPGLAELERQLLAIQRGEVLAKVFEDFVGPDAKLEDGQPGDRA
jgi:hypothetical protein